ncbi:hypothetical protein [Candidatus Lokiarchaeum ossiferum]|uniref:hypothetical protein n=1 Tax=Candidatus Lokiarchaeum ossiferum TaxID=2951803 RepID=UPI00352C1B4F
MGPMFMRKRMLNGDSPGYSDYSNQTEWCSVTEPIIRPMPQRSHINTRSMFLACCRSKHRRTFDMLLRLDRV